MTPEPTRRKAPGPANSLPRCLCRVGRRLELRLTFLGTRGNTKVASDAHRRHSALLVSYGGARIMIDCGADWLGRLGDISPDAIIVTHAHPDHAFGLKDGAPCPVYATAESWHTLDQMPIGLRELVVAGAPFEIGAVSFEAVTVIHSAIAPAVGYRATVGEASFFYVPDVLQIPASAEVLGGIDLYIGDGARLEHPIVRGKGARPAGHASIREQLSWCAGAKVSRAIFTHCGTPIINSDETSIRAALQALAHPFAIDASLAFDGEEIILGIGRRRTRCRAG